MAGILAPAVLAAHCQPVFGLGEHRMRGNAADGNSCGRDPQRFQMGTRFAGGDEVVIRRRTQPHAMDLEIRHHGDNARPVAPFTPLAID